MFLRWLFLFLVLANLLLLLWYSSFVTEQELDPASAEKQLNNIRLLSEIEPAALKVKGARQQVKPQECIYFSEFAKAESVDWLVSQVLADGFVTDTLTNSEIESRYIIKVEVSEASGIRQALSEYLRQNRGIGIKMQDLEPGALYVLGSYVDRSKAEKELQQVVISGVAAYLVLESVEDKRYTVVVHEEIERKLSSEIKELVKNRYSDVKITKKICERVASPQPTE